MSIYRLTGSLQHYVWGGKTYIPALLGQAVENDYTAECWLGAHRSAPSMIERDGKRQSLLNFLAENPTALGSQSLEQFGKELPYLFKILDVKQPLSIQLHPTKKQAERGFEAENQQGISLDSPTRTYKDNNHKPEMMIALSDFWLLHGFKPKQQIIESLKQRPSLISLSQKMAEMPLATCYAEIMQADQAQLAEWLLPIIEQNQQNYQQNALALDNPDYWVLYTLEAMQISLEKLDAGLLCFYLFNIVYLKQGEGIFQDAGIPHAYLRGQNIELMACSDNVIRGGLTPKYVDIPELLKVIDTQEIVPSIIPALDEQTRQFTYQTPAKDFALTNVRYAPKEVHQRVAENAEILFVMEGSVSICSTDEKAEPICLTQGQAVFITSNETYQLSGVEQGYCVISALP